MLSKQLVYFLIIGPFYASGSIDIKTLEAVHILSRHGEKNPDTKFAYPGDPYENMTFYPFSQGQLNLIGRQTMYGLGQSLHKRYHKFLGEIYSPEIVEAWASPLPRCIYSLQLIMASLFPPSTDERWNEDLNWQPTLFHFTEWDDDKFFRVMLSEDYVNLYRKTCRTDKSMQSKLEKYKPWLKYIEDHTGYCKDCSLEAYYLYIIMTSEHEFNLTLPDWSKPIFPEILEELTKIDYQLQIHTKELKRMIIGPLLHKILNDTQNRIHGNSKKKFHLYLGHELNIAHVLHVLGFMYPHIPGYGAHLAIEVHKIGHEHILKIFYQDSKHGQLKMLKNSQGDDHITWDRYKWIVQDIYIDDVNEDFKNATPKNIPNWWILFMSLCLLFQKI